MKALCTAVLRPTLLAASLPALMRAQLGANLWADTEYAAQLDKSTVKIPSEPAVASWLQPTHSSHISADWCTGELPIKWAVQWRVIRTACEDTQYVNILGVTARQYVLELGRQGETSHSMQHWTMPSLLLV
jgi:hypothetical protein